MTQEYTITFTEPEAAFLRTLLFCGVYGGGEGTVRPLSDGICTLLQDVGVPLLMQQGPHIDVNGWLADVDGLDPEEEPETTLDPWKDSDYVTVIGYMREVGLIEDDAIAPVVAQETIRDGFWCKARAIENGYSVIKVHAPIALRDMGIEFVNSYPRWIVERRVAYKYLT